jgi:hypothetical protein
MSIFRTEEVNCPSCGVKVEFELVHSVNAGRRPDLRDAILSREFQKQPCPSCGFAFRVEPQFTYTDLGRKQFYAVWPASKINDWQALEQKSQATFDGAFGATATPEARDIGEGLSPRTIFGWPGLNEKLVAAEANIEDHVLEMAKLAVIRGLEEAPIGGGSELRLLGVEEENLLFGWIRTGTEDLTEVVAVPKTLLAEIGADAEAWQPLRDELSVGSFVDYRRLVLGE